MLKKITKAVVGSRNQRILNKFKKIVLKINGFESELSRLTDDQLRDKTLVFKERVASGESLDVILPEAFAVVREGSRRVLGLRHHDVQLIGGMILHNGKISEMKTGEGKTLVATLAAYLNALGGEPVFIVTTNDYLASRDASEMGELYSFLGLTTGLVVGEQGAQDKSQAYQCDVVYGTNNEIGFDYLRENMVMSPQDRVMRGLGFVIIDEVDSILIDEARTPLVISGAVEQDLTVYEKINEIVLQLKRARTNESNKPVDNGDFVIDEKEKNAYLTEYGHDRVEEMFIEIGLVDTRNSLYDSKNIILMSHVLAGIRAHHVFKKGMQYIVRNNEVMIVDEFTGRILDGRRWNDGLHQAIEVKEGVKVNPETQTLANITYQSLFKLFGKVSGMTGTADTDAYEFQQVYGLEVVVVPTNDPMVRVDHRDRIYLTQEEKYDAIIDDIRDCQKRGQPVLVGTSSIDSSEVISKKLTQGSVTHEVLNAKQHEREAHIIAQAGNVGSVTIATNMAGRGTDIVLGGSWKEELAEMGEITDKQRAKVMGDWEKRHQTVKQAGGLHVIGAERNESRRVDNQLRGRSGRQGDKGSSRFYLSLEDDLMRIFGGEKLRDLISCLGLERGEPIENSLVARSIEKSQQRIENHYFEARKELLKFDQVATEQRSVIYDNRNEIIDAEGVSDIVHAMVADVVEETIYSYMPQGSIDEAWDLEGLGIAFQEEFMLSVNFKEWVEMYDSFDEHVFIEDVVRAVFSVLEQKESIAPEGVWKDIERSVLVETMDRLWREHLEAMEHMRRGIHLRTFAQQKPEQEYQKESFSMFSQMLDGIKREVVAMVSHLNVSVQESPVSSKIIPRSDDFQYDRALML